MNTKTWMLLCALAFVLPVTQVSAESPVFPTDEAPVKRDVPYVPTPQEVVDEMLGIATVGPNDMLIDLGCGDGRIVVTAARNFGTRGIGVDIDPERIRESIRNAAESGVDGKVQFVRGNLFEMDLRPASVLTLYLLPSVNLELRPKILNELKAGSRVVSHDFDMEEWAPDMVSKIQHHTIYFWLVPANVTGSWSWVLPGDDGEQKYGMELSQEFQFAKGTFSAAGNRSLLSDVRIEGDIIRFQVTEAVEGRPVSRRFEGRVRGHLIEGEIWTDGEKDPERWIALRDPETAEPLEESGDDIRL